MKEASISSDAHQKMMSTYQLILLQKDTISISTFENIRTLLKGIDPRVDKKLEICSKALHTLRKLHSGEVIELSAEVLPEGTEQQKKRKKALLFFIYSLKDLTHEIERIDAEFTHANKSGGSQVQKNLTSWGRIIGFAKGPLGVITIIAIAILALRLTEVEIVIKNVGCNAIQPAFLFAVNIPGLVLPHQAILSSGEAVAKMPPIQITADNTSSDIMRLSIFGLPYALKLNDPSMHFFFDNAALNGTSTVINLGQKRRHELVISCR